MKLLLVAIIFVIGAYANTADSLCPSATPYRCWNNLCVAQTSDCPVRNCSGATPYLCSDGVTCAISSKYCNCQGALCWDGSCKNSMFECPIFFQCSEDYPRRCPDGTCHPYDSSCANATGTVCPPGLDLCVDGICRLPDLCLDLRYYGCPKYQCPNGLCTENWVDCECAPGIARCYDGTCMAIGPGGWPKCAVTAPGFVNPQNVTVTVNTTIGASFPVQSDTSSSTTIVAVRLAPGAISPLTLNGTTTTTNITATPLTINSFTVQGVSTTTTSGTTTIDNVGNTYGVTLLSQPVNFTIGGDQSQLSNNSTATLSFPIAPTGTVQTACVATLNNGTWECVPSLTSGTTQTVVEANVTHFSIYAVIKQELYSCSADCPESPCSDTVFDLKTADGSVTVGYLEVNNKMGVELQFEAFTFENRFDNTYGWALSGMLIEVGQKLFQIDYSVHSDKYRDFTTIQLADAFPNQDRCGTTVPFLFVAAVREDGPCANNDCTVNPVTTVVYAFPRNKRNTPSVPYPSTPSAFIQNYEMCCTCSYRSQLLSDWGKRCSQSVIGCYRDVKFSPAFPGGFKLGCAAGKQIKFTSSEMTRIFMDTPNNQFDAPNVLDQDYVNPTTTPAGKFAGFLASISLSDRFDRLDTEWASSCNFLRDINICGGACSPFIGKTIGQVIQEANNVLGGCSAGNPADYVTCFDDIERTFYEGRRLDQFVPRGYSVDPCN